MRKTHPAAIKLKVALAALTGQPIVDVCKQFEVAESLVHKWKKQLKENGVVVFQDCKAKQSNDFEEIDKLHQVIGKLTTELEFLKKVLRA
jgi:transposase-like protein